MHWRCSDSDIKKYFYQQSISGRKLGILKYLKFTSYFENFTEILGIWKNLGNTLKKNSIRKTRAFIENAKTKNTLSIINANEH